MDKELDIANYIILLIKENKFLLNEQDLIYSYKIFIETEEYEKCGVLNDLINSKKINNDFPSFFNTYSTIQTQKNNIKIILKKLNDLPKDEKINNMILEAEYDLKEYDDLENDFWVQMKLFPKLLKQKVKDLDIKV
jgi:hypothetical protein